MSNGLVPPIQMIPMEDGGLRFEIEDEESEQFACVTLSRQQVKYLITILKDWHESTKEQMLF